MNVLMPQLGETVAEGTVAAWHKKQGDTVEKNEVLLDVETDKAATEVPAPVAGVIASVLVPEGKTVDVGAVLAVIETEEAAELTEVSESSGEKATTKTSSSSSGNRASAKRSGRQSAKGARVDKTARASTARGRGGKTERLRLSPVVRRLLAEHGVDAQEITGSGRDGRITRKDVLAFVEQRAAEESKPSVPEPAARPAPVKPPAPTPSEAPAEPARVPFDRIRRITAEHMVHSKATSAHVMQAVEVDFSGVDRVRLPKRNDWRSRQGFSLTYLPFIARATCLALRDYPNINSSVDGDALVLHPAVHLCIAVNLNFEGLVAPVIRDADSLTVAGLAHAIHDIGDRARKGELNPDEYSGGTYTLSNNGSYGTLLTGAIINQPQVAILSVDAIRKRPVVVESPQGDSIAIRPVGILAQSFDHRAIDGAYSAAFLQKVRSLLERKDWSDEL
ncbi:MAG: dihydrolipoamide acetyltransferase family protein [Rhodospirillaceae bacterium]|nr:dihydrolipoamide acetyltransferase family protein [Rhodospirillaceae bacterium]MDD9996386.1 dihydrolipoamide acetyltransferase family protein [Rhodospirillaceae bacterium]MDE0362216.1 dihydrolipoamide acetyltransferase family protein [Rhodospirillaceae bacterium]